MVNVREVDTVGEVTAELVDAFARLVPQLSSSANPPNSDELVQIVTDPDTTLFVADVGGAIAGTLTLVVFRIPTGVRAWIEDVVVDADAARQGIGAALNEAALRKAETLGAKTVDLTSRPSREAANRLYQRIGFKKRETNLYRYDANK